MYTFTAACPACHRELEIELAHHPTTARGIVVTCDHCGKTSKLKAYQKEHRWQKEEIDRVKRKAEARRHREEKAARDQKLREEKAARDQKLRVEQQHQREEFDRRQAERKASETEDLIRQAAATRQAMRVEEMAKLAREPLVPREDDGTIGNYILGFFATIFLIIGLLVLVVNLTVGTLVFISGLLMWIIVILDASRKGIYRVLRELQFARMSQAAPSRSPNQTASQSEPPSPPA